MTTTTTAAWTGAEQTDRGLSFIERVFKRDGDGCPRAVTVLRHDARADLLPDAELKIGGGCRDYIALPMLSSTPAIVVASSSDGDGAVKMEVEATAPHGQAATGGKAAKLPLPPEYTNSAEQAD